MCTGTRVPYGFTFHNYCVIAVPTLVLASLHPEALLSSPDFSFSLIQFQTEFGFLVSPVDIVSSHQPIYLFLFYLPSLHDFLSSKC